MYFPGNVPQSRRRTSSRRHTTSNEIQYSIQDLIKYNIQAYNSPDHKCTECRKSPSKNGDTSPTEVETSTILISKPETLVSKTYKNFSYIFKYMQ